MFGDAAEPPEPGGVDDDVDGSAALEECGDGGFVGDVHPGSLVRCTEFVGTLRSTVCIAVGDGDLPPGGGETLGHRPADPRRATDDNRSLR